MIYHYVELYFRFRVQPGRIEDYAPGRCSVNKNQVQVQVHSTDVCSPSTKWFPNNWQRWVVA